MPEQLSSDDNIVYGSAGESLVLLILRIGLVVDHKIEDRSSLIGVGDKNFLTYCLH